MKTNIHSILAILLALFLGSCSDDEKNHGNISVSCDQALDGWSVTTVEFPSGYRQKDMVFVDENVGFTVGRTGTILKTINGGLDWRTLEYYYTTETGVNEDAITKAQLEAVYFINAQVGFAGGDGESLYSPGTFSSTDAVFLKTIDGGENWEKTYLEGIREIYDLIFFDEQNGLGIFSIENDENLWIRKIMATHDGGHSWTAIELSPDPIKFLNFILTPSRIIVWTEGYPHINHLWSTSDQGQTWQSQRIPDGPCGNIYFITDQIVYANCPTLDKENGILQSMDGGMTWTEIVSPLFDWSLFHFMTPDNGFVINPIYRYESGSGESWAVLDYYEVYQTGDEEDTWKKTRVEADCDFEGIHFSPSPHLFYCLGSHFIRFEKK